MRGFAIARFDCIIYLQGQCEMVLKILCMIADTQVMLAWADYMNAYSSQHNLYIDIRAVYTCTLICGFI